MKIVNVPRRALVSICLISASLAIIVCFVSNNLNVRFQNRAATVNQQFALLEGETYLVDGVESDWPPFRSRVLFPAMLSAVSRWEILPPHAWFVILRLATAFLMLLLFSLFLMEVSGASTKLAAVGSGWLTLGLIPTFNHGWEHPTDFPDVIFFTLFLWFALKKKKAALLAAAVVASLNRQSAAFAGVLWLCLHGFDSRRKPLPAEIAYSGLVMGGAYLTSWFAKWLVHGDAGFGYLVNGYRTIEQFLEFLRHPWSSGWPVLLFAMATPTVAWLYANRKAFSGTDKRILWAVALTICISSVIAFMAELRSVFLAPHVMATFVAASAEVRVQGMSPEG